MPAPKVGFLVIGAQKAGTTTLDHYLRQHPDIGMAEVKEVHYFDDEEHFAHEPVDHAVYEARFPGARLIHGEVTPIYLYWEPCCERIHRYNAGMKLVAVLRDPVDRAWSQWNMEFNRGDEHRDFRTAVEAELEQLRTDPGVQHRVRSYLARGFYGRQIERYQRTFGPHRLLCVGSEALREDPLSVLNRIFDHLGVRPLTSAAPVQLNTGDYKAECDPGLRRELHSVFAEDMRRTAALTGIELGDLLR